MTNTLSEWAAAAAKRQHIEFTVLGGRLFAHHAERDRLDRQIIELKCEASSGGWFDGTSVTIGNDDHARIKLHEDDGANPEKPVEMERGWQLVDIPTVLTLHRTNEHWIDDGAAKNDGKPLVGRFEYHAMTDVDDAVQKDRRPHVSAWVGVGPETFELIRSRLLSFERYDFQVVLGIVFPEPAVDNVWKMGKVVDWSGAAPLDVELAIFVWKRDDWSPDFHRKERLPVRAEERPWEPGREHLDAMAAKQRIEARLRSLAIPLWMVVGLLILVVLRRL